MVDKHGKASINFQISVTLYMIISGILSIILIGIPFLIGFAILQLVGIIIATIKTSNGEEYKYPLTIEFIK